MTQPYGPPGQPFPQYPGPPAPPAYPPGPYPQAGMHPGQYGAAQQPGFLRITIQGNAWKSFIPPTVSVDGGPTTRQYGTVDVPVAPGMHHVSAESHSLWTYGRAAMNVTVRPGEVVPVFYNAPWNAYVRGSIGFEPQRANGLGLLIGILSGTFLIVLMILLIAVLSAL